MHDHSGRSIGLTLLLLLIVALIVAYLAATQTGRLGFGQKPPTHPTESK